MFDGLDEVEWQSLRDAYGDADNVANCIRALLSDDAQRRDNARWELSSTIYHQGDIYDSTAFAIPFLIEIVVNPTSPDRTELLYFIDAIAQTAEISDELVQCAWQKRFEYMPYLNSEQRTAIVRADIADRRKLRSVFVKLTDRLAKTLVDEDDGMAVVYSRLMQRMQNMSKIADHR